MALTRAKLIADGVIDVDNLAAGHSITTSNIGEGSNLYYTDGRVASYLTTNSYATEGYVTTAVANLVDSAPSTLDTLNELAAALGDDPNFATTVTNSIATKLPLSGGTVSGNLTVTGSLTGTLATAAQTNITSVGTLTGLTVSADASINSLTVGRGAGNISINTALGDDALAANTTGDKNSAFGFNALADNTSGRLNTAVGHDALSNNTTGNSNTAIGTDTLVLNTTGVSNTAVGHAALLYTTSSNNTAIGRTALYLNTTGADNTAVGTFALEANTTGEQNTAVGKGALLDNTTGINNTAVGVNALTNNTTAADNTAVGRSAMISNTTGTDNTALGNNSGDSLTTGNNNLFLGHLAGRSTSPSGQITTQSNNVVLGDNNITNLYCADTTISSSDARDKTDVEDFTYGLDWITQLRPVTYRWDKRAWYVDNDSTTDDLLNAQPDGSKKRSKLHIGFLAQEELEVEKQFGFGETKDDMLIANINEDESAYGIKYERLVPVLVNAIKELKAEIELLKAK